MKAELRRSPPAPAASPLPVTRRRRGSFCWPQVCVTALPAWRGALKIVLEPHSGLPGGIFRDGDRKGRVRASPDTSPLAAFPPAAVKRRGKGWEPPGFGAGRIWPPVKLWCGRGFCSKKSWEVLVREPCASRGEGPPESGARMGLGGVPYGLLKSARVMGRSWLGAPG